MVNSNNLVGNIKYQISNSITSFYRVAQIPNNHKIHTTNCNITHDINSLFNPLMSICQFVGFTKKVHLQLHTTCSTMDLKFLGNFYRQCTDQITFLHRPCSTLHFRCNVSSRHTRGVHWTVTCTRVYDGWVRSMEQVNKQESNSVARHPWRMLSLNLFLSL